MSVGSIFKNIGNIFKTTEEIEASLFADALTKDYTRVRLKLIPEVIYEARTVALGTTGRINNIKKALELIKGVELMPGDVFSYNLALGERNEANGWFTAPAYANNEVVQEYGGGICQVSSTLYMAVLYANLHIVSRDCHQFDPGYLPFLGIDATVSWGAPDFRFCNNTDHPIRIVAWYDDSTREACVRIVGTDVDHQYVIIRFNRWYIDDDEKRVDSAAKATGEMSWIGRFVYNEGDDYNTATPVGGDPNYESYSKYGFHEH